MKVWLRSKWKALAEWWLEEMWPAPVYSVPGIPTADEMAARCNDFAQELACAREDLRLMRLQRDALTQENADLRAQQSAASSEWLADRVPHLGAAQIERLALLIEECGEVAQVAAKVLRHGYRGVNPIKGGPNNRVLLERELGDLRCAMDLMFNACDVRSRDVAVYRRSKHEIVSRWLHQQQRAAAPVAANDCSSGSEVASTQ